MYRKEVTDALAAETMYAALFTNTLAYDQLNVAHTTYTQIAALFTESTGTGYTAGGKQLTTTSGYIGATNASALTATASAWAITTALTCRYAVIYEFTGKKIRAVIDLGGDKVVTSGTITVTWDGTNGIISVA